MMKTSIENQQQTQKQHEISQEIKKLTEKQQVPQSFLSKLAATYVHYPAWLRWGLGLLFAGIGSVTSFFALPFLFPWVGIGGAVLGLVCYILPTRILRNHYQAEVEYQKKLSNEVLKLEQVLHESIQTIQSLEKPMHSLLNSLEVKNNERARSNELFQASVVSLKQQAEEAEHAIETLQDHQQMMQEQNQVLSSVVEETTEAHHKLGQTQQEISQMNEALLSTQERLNQDATVFHDLADDVAQRNTELNELHGKLKSIEQHAVQTQRTFETQLQRLNQSLSEGEHSNETREEQEESSEMLQQKVLANLDRFIRQKRGQQFFSLAAPVHLVPQKEQGYMP